MAAVLQRSKFPIIWHCLSISFLKEAESPNQEKDHHAFKMEISGKFYDNERIQDIPEDAMGGKVELFQ